MNRKLALTLIGGLLSAVLVLPAARAATIVECVDRDGSVTFSDRCPPGAVKKSERQYAGLGNANTGPRYSAPIPPAVTLYTSTNCDACDLVRNILDTRSVPYSEKNAGASIATQDELRAATGALNVPTVLVGENIVSGYNRVALETALTQAGYITAPATAQ